MVADVLFICHTQYQAMVSVVKVLCAPEGFRADFWLSAALPARAQLAARLQEAGLAGRTFLPQDNTEQYPSLENTSLLMRRTMALQACGSGGDFRCAWASTGKSASITTGTAPGVICRTGAWPMCWGRILTTIWTIPTHWIDDQTAEPGFAKRQLTGEGYLFWGAYRGVAAVEVGQAGGSGLLSRQAAAI